jgi:hypothetical protein
MELGENAPRRHYYIDIDIEVEPYTYIYNIYDKWINNTHNTQKLAQSCAAFRPSSQRGRPEAGAEPHEGGRAGGRSGNALCSLFAPSDRLHAPQKRAHISCAPKRAPDNPGLEWWGSSSADHSSVGELVHRATEYF